MSDRDGMKAIYVANADGTGIRRVTAGERPAWAPGGRRLAFHRGGSIYTINVDGSNEARVTAGFQPAWSPEGDRLAFATASGIYVIGMDGSGLTRVVNPSAWNTANAEYGASYPSWSPDGHKIAFIRTSYDESWSLYVLDLQAQTEPYVLVRQGVAEHTSWSRDGSRIAFGYAPFRLGPPTAHVIMIGVVTTGGSVTEAAQGFHPDWTPTGDLVFNQFTGPGTASNFLGSSMRIFVSTSTQPLIPEAVAPARADYWDQDAAWER